MSEYNPAHWTPHFSKASPKHLRSSSVYSDALHIRLHMLHNSAPPPASMPPHVPPLLVCLFVYLCYWRMLKTGRKPREGILHSLPCLIPRVRAMSEAQPKGTNSLCSRCTMKVDLMKRSG